MPHVRSLFAAGVGACLLAASPPSLAAIATASFAWDELEISVLAIPEFATPGISYEQLLTEATASANTFEHSSGSHSHSSFNWTASFAVGVDTPHGTAAGTVSSSELGAVASATSSFSLTLFATNSGNAMVRRSADFVLSGPGVVVFSVPYSLSVTGDLFDFEEHSRASISGSATFPGFGGVNGTTSGNKSFSLDSFFSEDSFLSGTMIFGVVADAAGTGRVDFLAQTSAMAVVNQIPEPSVVAQVLAGLLGLVVVARRRLALLVGR